MTQLTRHKDIADCIAELLSSSITDPYQSTDVRVEDFDQTALPSMGIIVSPEAANELMGTSERDDIQYSCLVMRIAHALGSEDLERRLSFAADVRLILHRKRLTCGPDCQLYSTVEFGKVAIPQKWSSENNSVIILRVNTIVRESRERE